MKLLFLALVCLVCGCSNIRVYDETRQAGFTATIPAWPWQDSTRVIERMNLSSKTNAFTASMRGLNETETTSTNATSIVTDIVGAAVRAAIKP